VFSAVLCFSPQCISYFPYQATADAESRNDFSSKKQNKNNDKQEAFTMELERQMEKASSFYFERVATLNKEVRSRKGLSGN
jgi:hypothetical protein